MRRLGWGIVFTALGAACLDVPQAQDPPEAALKATATVDARGRVIEGGNLIVDIPAGAIPEADRIQVTIEEILGAPAGHLSEAYLVKPEGYQFDEPVLVTYRYSDRNVRDVLDEGQLFLGTAEGAGWVRLAQPEVDVDLNRVRGRTTHFSVFGLIDPQAAVDGGVLVYDGSAPDTHSGLDAGPGQDAARPDSAAGVDGATSGDAGGEPNVQIVLTWTGPAADLDLHLLRLDGAQFSSDDCYYANCKPRGQLDWPPTGAGNDPWMEIDDVNGLGPENIWLFNPVSGAYIVGMHVWSLHNDPLPMDYTVRITHNGGLVLETTRAVSACNDFIYLADVTVSGSGNLVSASARSDAPFPSGQNGGCP